MAFVVIHHMIRGVAKRNRRAGVFQVDASNAIDELKLSVDLRRHCTLSISMHTPTISAFLRGCVGAISRGRCAAEGLLVFTALRLLEADRGSRQVGDLICRNRDGYQRKRQSS